MTVTHRKELDDHSLPDYSIIYSIFVMQQYKEWQKAGLKNPDFVDSNKLFHKVILTLLNVGVHIQSNEDGFGHQVHVVPGCGKRYLSFLRNPVDMEYLKR
jgi:hypothetical protein